MGLVREGVARSKRLAVHTKTRTFITTAARLAACKRVAREHDGPILPRPPAHRPHPTDRTLQTQSRRKPVTATTGSKSFFNGCLPRPSNPADGPSNLGAKPHMKAARLAVPVVALAAFVACGDPTGTDGLIDDSAITQDVAATAGASAADMIAILVANQIGVVGAPEAAGATLADAPTSNIAVTRSVTCLNADGAVVACGNPSVVRKIITAATIKGTHSATRTKEGGATVTWTGTVNRSSNDTIQRVFTAGTNTETSRIHNGNAIGNDTTTFTDATLTRKIAEAVRDSVKTLTFTLPRSSNPYPTSGSIVRNSTVDVQVTAGERSASATKNIRVEVLFPADAQANVTLKVNSKTCSLNLVTRAVSNCQ